MEESMWQVLKIVFAIVVLLAFITIIYLLKDMMMEKIVEVKDIFSNLF